MHYGVSKAQLLDPPPRTCLCEWHKGKRRWWRRPSRHLGEADEEGAEADWVVDSEKQLRIESCERQLFFPPISP